MTLKIFDGVSTWNTVQRLKVFRNSVLNTWITAKKVSVWRGSEASGYWSVVYPSQPFALYSVSADGTAIPGYTVSVSNTAIWDTADYRAVDTVVYQWQRSTDEITWSDITSANSTSYIVQNADVGYYLRCKLTASNENPLTAVEYSSRTMRVNTPDYTFNFNGELGVNSNAFILLDKTNGVFPDADPYYLAAGKILAYFMSDSDHFRIWYKSDTTNFRIYHQIYRSARTSRPATPDAEYEVVFTDGSKIVDVYVVKTDSGYLLPWWETAYYLEQSGLKYYPSYGTGIRYRVTMDGTTAVTTASGSPSTTLPSNGAGWIDVNSKNDTDSGTVAFSSGTGSYSPVSANVNGAFTKSNMFFPSTPSVANPAYLTPTTALVAWTSGSIPGNSFYVTVTRNDTSAQVFAGSTTSSSITLQNLVLGVTHTVSVSANSRSETSPFSGQFGFAGTIQYLHATVPDAVQSITASNPTTGLVGGLISGIFWSVAWSAPASNGGSAVTDYEWATDWDAGGASYGFGGETSTSNSLSASVGILNGLQAYVRVRARNAKGPGPWSQITLNSSPSQPGTPSAGAITSTNAQTSVSWAASNANGGTSLAYRVYRSQNTNVWNERTTAAQSNTSYSDNIAGSGTTYYYKVIPENKLATNVTFTGIESNASAALTVTQPTVNTPVVSGSNQSTTINVSWSGSGGSGSTPSYQLYRGQNSSNLTAFGTGTPRMASAQTATSFPDTGTAGDNTYYYRVDLTNNINSVASGVSSGLTLSPGAPGKPAINAQSNTNNNVTMNWTAATNNLSSGAINYRVYRSQNTNVWNEVTANGILNNTNRTFVDLYNQPTSPPVTFYYRVDAVNVYAQVASPYSNAISAS